MESELNLTTSSAQAVDMSVFGLFMMADPVVKAVMLLLIGASVWCWAIIFDKMTRIRRQKRGAEEFDEMFWSVARLMICIMILVMSLTARRPKSLVSDARMAAGNCEGADL